MTTETLTPAEEVVARLHRRRVELEEAIVIDALMQSKASELATFDAAVRSFTYWSSLRQSHEDLLAELRTILDPGYLVADETELERAAARG